MKKTLALILALIILVLPIVSCDSEDSLETNAPATDAPATDDPVTDDPVTDDPVTDDPVTDDPVTDDPSLREDDEKLYVGYGRECITPYGENGKLLSGYTLAGYAEKRNAKSVKDDIFASCTAIKDKNGNTALLYTLDLHSMTAGNAKSLQKTVSRALDVPEEKIVLNVTHTHAAPNTVELLDILEEMLVSAAEAAISDLTLVSALYTGIAETENMNFIRRYVYDKNGTPTAHTWENDGDMPIVRFVREGKKDVILCNWAAHCDTVKATNSTTISADYVSYFRTKAETDLDAYLSVHMAAAGDVSPAGYLESEPAFAGTVAYGKALATCLADAIDSLERQTIKSDVQSNIEKVRVSFDHSEDDRGEDACEVINYYWDVASGNLTNDVLALIAEKGFENIYEVEAIRDRYLAEQYDRISVGALSIGNVVFGIAPYEMFTLNGKNIKSSADEFDLAFMCAYSNGMLGYIASEEAFEYDIYEVYSRRYTKDTATLLQNSIIASIDELGK